LNPDQGFFAVYDGHGGRGIVDFVAEHYHQNFAEELNFDAERSVADCVTSAYLITDIQSRKAGLMSSGSTAVTAFLQHKNGKRFLHIANVGDARAVISHKGQAHRLTYDRKATDEREQKRIEEAGGFVLRGRVLGILAVARSFGDHSLKQFVSARPHITITEITADHDFVALCCDGVFDVMEDDDVINFIKENSQKGPNPKIAEMLVEEALKRRTTHNVTAMVVYL
jgi:serine/threonine protein phosphatase PrpC